MTTFKALATTLLATSLLAGCAATDPYTPESDKDFIYDNDMSFAMNVIDGSLGFHNGLRDANRPVDADTSPGAMDYIADGVIGFGGGGGFGGAFLSMLGTNQGNAPLDGTVGIAYIPVKNKDKESINKAFSKIDNDIVSTISKNFDLNFVEKIEKDSYTYFYFSGSDCKQYNTAVGSKEPSNTCVFAGYDNKQLVKFSSTNPNKSKGLYAVIKMTSASTGLFYNFFSTSEYFAFYPKGFKSDFPFVINDGKAYLFVKPSINLDEHISIQELIKLNSKVSLYYKN